MHMWYWFGTNLGTFLFSGYNVDTVWALLSTCLGLAGLAIIFEVMKISDIKLRQIAAISSREKPAISSSEDSSLLSRVSVRSFVILPFTHCGSWYRWTFQVLHWVMHTILGYILMMAIMTYNGYVSIAVIIGSCIGYWIFGPTIIQLNVAQFRESQKAIRCEDDCIDINNREERQVPVVCSISEQVTETVAEVHR